MEAQAQNGSWLKGDPGTNYISVGSELSGYQGYWILNQDGLNLALHDLDSIVREEHD